MTDNGWWAPFQGLVQSGKRRLFSKDDPNWRERFQKTDLSQDAPWSEHYSRGVHRAIWDHSFPSPQLVGYVLGSRFNAGARALDMGCGSGQDAVFLASRNLEVHGLDFSAEAINVAEKTANDRGVSVSWHHGSALSTPFDRAYFDLITDRGCFHHIGGERRAKYAEEIVRILKPGGVLFLRGCRRSQPPFYPVNSETIAETFDRKLFDYSAASEVPFYLVVDAGGLEATAVTIVRRP